MDKCKKCEMPVEDDTICNVCDAPMHSNCLTFSDANGYVCMDCWFEEDDFFQNVSPGATDKKPKEEVKEEAPKKKPSARKLEVPEEIKEVIKEKAEKELEENNTVNRKELASVLKLLLPGTEKVSNYLEGTDSFIFTEDTIYTFNTDVIVSVENTFPIVGVYHAQTLFKSVNKLKGDVIKVEQNDKELILKAGRATISIVQGREEVLSKITKHMDNITYKDVPQDFMEALSLCLLAKNRHPLRGVYCDGEVLLSTDMARISMATLAEELDVFYVDDSNIEVLVNFPTVNKIAIVDDFLHFLTEEGVKVSVKQKIMSNYPSQKLRKYLVAATEQEIVWNTVPENIKSAIESAAIFSMNDEKEMVVEFIVDKDELEIRSKIRSGGFAEKMGLEHSVGRRIETIVDLKFLKEIAKEKLDFAIVNIELGGIQPSPVIVFSGLGGSFVKIVTTRVAEDEE